MIKVERAVVNGLTGVLLQSNGQMVHIRDDDISDAIDALYEIYTKQMKRIDIIGQNGNTGEHYGREDRLPDDI